MLLGAAALLAGAPASAEDRIAWIEDLGLSTARPLILPPRAAGAVIAIDERRKTDSYTQVVTLAGDPGTVGENSVTTVVTRDGLAPRLEQASVSADMDGAVPPGMPMALGPAGLANRLGIYGRAVGREGALSCLYGWQTVNLADRLITRETVTIFDEQHALSIRVRVCRTTLDAGALAAVMDGLHSGFAGASAPVDDRDVDGADALSAAAAGGAAPGPSLAPTAAAAVPTRTPVHRARRPSAGVVTRASRPETPPDDGPPPSPLAGMPSVPLPPP